MAMVWYKIYFQHIKHRSYFAFMKIWLYLCLLLLRWMVDLWIDWCNQAAKSVIKSTQSYQPMQPVFVSKVSTALDICCPYYLTQTRHRCWFDIPHEEALPSIKQDRWFRPTRTASDAKHRDKGPTATRNQRTVVFWGDCLKQEFFLGSARNFKNSVTPKLIGTWYDWF